LAQFLGGVAERQHFGMGRGIVARLNLIAGPRQHLAGLISDNGAHRHLATFSGGTGFFKRNVHRRHDAFLP
jgi:hypothetical protein